MTFFTKLLCSMLCILLVFSLVGCQSDEAIETAPAVNDTQPSTDTISLSEAYTYYDEINTLLRDAIQYGALARTAVPFCKKTHPFDPSKNVAPAHKDSPTYVLATLCSETACNPLSAFRLLVDHGYYQEEGSANSDTIDLLFYEGADGCLNAVTAPITPQSYFYSFDGCKDLLEDIFDHCYIDNERIDIVDNAIQATQNNLHVFYSSEEDCYYAYFGYGTSSTFSYLNVYFRSEDGVHITDVSFDRVRMQYFEGYYAGWTVSYGLSHDDEMRQLLTLIAATEKVLTGKTSFDQYENGDLSLAVTTDSPASYLHLPKEYTIGNYTASLKKESFSVDRTEGYFENCNVVSFRIRT